MAVEARPAGTGAEGRWLAATGAALAIVLGANAVASGDHWWANFVLFPGAAMAAFGVPLLLGGRRRAGVGYLVLSLAVIVCAVGLLLLFGAMNRGWPLMIILPCLAVAGTARWQVSDPNARAAHRTVVGLALLSVCLGVTFLAIHAGLIDPGDTHWWSYFMMAAGLVAVGNGLSLVPDLRGYRLSTTVLLAGLGAVTVLSGVRELLWR